MRKLYALLAGFLFTLLAIDSNALPATPDVANFSFSIQHETKVVVFTNTSSLGNEPGVRRAYWNFGDGSGTWTPPLLGTQHQYQHPGTYTVCLRIFRYRPNHHDSVLSAQVCKTVVINTVCKANFETIEEAANTNPLLVIFRALPWHNDEKRPVRICWDFGDGKDTCIQYSNTNPGPYTVRHRYNTSGVYNVCVRILYQGGCEATKCKEIRVFPPDSCRANFEKVPTPSNNPLKAAFRALPWHNNNKKPQRICWQFGDGKDTCINYPAGYNGQYLVYHRYNQPGRYEVCVGIRYAGGCEARKCEAVIIGRPDSCRADFERLPSATPNPLDAAFKAIPWHNNNKKPRRICWQFGDGRDTCISYPENYNGIYGIRHLYPEPGRYEVCVNIDYFGGCESRQCKGIIIQRPDSCRANFERLPLNATTPLTAGFKAIPWHNNDKKPKTICWQFGDGRDTCIQYPENYTGNYQVIHRYLQPGDYNVCVGIIYYGGCDARKCKEINIPPPPVTCQVRLLEITPSISSLVRGFLAVPHATPARRPLRICWSFGDGEDTCIMIDPQQPLPDLMIRHTYPAPGIYRACVRILFDGGCRADDCKEVVIRSATNICGGFMTDSLTGPRSYRFKGFSIHAPNDEAIGFRWTFGDGSSAEGREVNHVYQQAGDYEVCLYTRTRLGCITKVCRTVRVPGNNEPALVLTPNPVINNLHARFRSTHTEQVTIRLLNNNGVPLRTLVRNVTTGINQWDFEVGGLLPGLYSLVVQSPNQLASAIFIKQ